MNISLSKRLLVTNLFFAIPFSAVIWLLHTAKSQNISFTDSEIVGNKYQVPVENLMRTLSQHRLISQRFVRGDKTLANQLSTIQDEFGKHLEALRDENEKSKQTLKFTPSDLSERKREHLVFENLSKEWLDLRSNVATLSVNDVHSKHAHIMGMLRATISHLGDTSNLVLDPDLDSFYLMDVSLVVLPQTQDRLQEILAQTEGMVRRRRVESAERDQLLIWAKFLKEVDFDRINADLDIALSEDKNFNGTSETLQNRIKSERVKYQSATEEFIKILGELALSETVSLSIEQYLSKSETALLASFDFWTTVSAELNTLLELRTRNLHQERTLSLTLAILAMGIGTTVCYFVGRRISQQMLGLASDLGRESAQTNTMSQSLKSVAEEVSSASTQQSDTVQETVLCLKSQA